MAKMMPKTVGGTAVGRTAKTSTDSSQLVVEGEEISVVAGNLTVGTLLGNIRLPKSAQVVFVMLDATDLDTNGSPTLTLEIGDAGDTDRLLAANTIAQSGAAVVGPTIAKTGFGYEYTAETLVQVRVAAGAATGASGTIKYAVAYVSN